MKVDVERVATRLTGWLTANPLCERIEIEKLGDSRS